MKLLACFVLIINATFGCSFRPDYKRPAAPVSEQYRDAETENSNTVQLENWVSYFKDPNLQAIINVALKNNRDLRITSEKIKQARATYGIQRASQLPTLGASAEGTLAKMTSVNSMVPGKQTSDANIFQASLGISAWELDFWGKLESLKQAALEAYLASVEGQRATKLSLVTQIAQSYLLQAELVQRMAIAQGTLGIREETLRIAQRRFQVGSGTKIEIEQATILLNQARSELTVLNRYKEQNLNALTLMAGTNLPNENIPKLDEIESYYLADIPVGVPSELLNRRPDILAAEHMLKASNANIGAARAAYMPSISLTAAYSQSSIDLDNLFQGHGHMWSFSPKVNLPIFTGGALSSNLKMAKAKKEEAIASYERAIQNAFREVSDVLAERKWTKEQLEIQKQTLDAQTERANISKKRYDKGSASYLEVLDSERDKFTVEQGLVQIRRSYLATSINLFAALGGEPDPANTSKE